MTCSACSCGTLPDVPAHVALDVYRGDTLTLVLEMIDTAGDLIDISGRTYAASIRSSWDATTSVDFAVSVDLPTSTVTLSLTDTQTENDVPRRGIWDVQQVTVATGDIMTLVRGPVVAQHDVTT